MKNYFEEIKKKLKKEINFEKLEIVDNTYKHESHKSFQKGKYHLKLKIKSVYLKSLKRLDAQKIVMQVLRNDLKNKIHALEISIE